MILKIKKMNNLPDKNLPHKIRKRIKEKTPIHDLRIKVFFETVKLTKNGGYELNGKFIKIDNSGVVEKSVFFDSPPKIERKGNYKTKYQVIEADCLETAEIFSKIGYKTALLNMANGKNPGGGVIHGAGAQEENIFRRTNLFLSLYQFADYAKKYGIKKNEKQYPINENGGGIYSPDITVFRASENNGYEFLSEPYKVSIITVPAINSPNLEFIDGKFKISKKHAAITKEKIRAILRIGAYFDNEILVLSAFGCGAFGNPPEHMAELFKEVFLEEEFRGIFRMIIFSIINDKNSPSDGNVYPFFKVFNEL